jgi:YD repeat-containing protein
MVGGIWRSSYDRSLVIAPPSLIPDGTTYPIFVGGGNGGTNSSCSPIKDCGGGGGAFSLVHAHISGGAIMANRPDGRAFVYMLNGSMWVRDADVNGTLTSVTDSSGTIIGYTFYTIDDDAENYDTDGRLQSIVHRNGITETLAYNTGDLLTSVTDTYGRKLQFAYDTKGRLTTVTDDNSRVWTYAYDSSNRMTMVTYPDQTTRQYLYANGSFPAALTGVIDEKGVQVDTTGYDSGGRANSQAQAGNTGSISLSYASSSNNTVGTTTMTEASGLQTTTTYAQILRVAKISQVSRAVGGTSYGTMSYTYDANGNLATATDYKGNSTHYTFDSSRNLETSRTEAYGTPRARTISTTWSSSFRQPTVITEADASSTVLRTTTYTYDSHGNCLSKTVTGAGTSVSRVWSWTYNSTGQVLTASDPDGRTMTYTYSNTGNGNLSTSFNNLGQTTTFGNYDAVGNARSITDPNGTVTTLSYDSRYRLTASTTTAGSVNRSTGYSYDAAGQLTQVTLPEGNVVSYVYDNAHRLTEIHDNAGNKIIYTLDSMGNRLSESVTDSGGLGSALDWIKRQLGLVHPAQPA